MNGPRVLSNDRLSYLIISTPTTEPADILNYNLFICAAHFIGDGAALNQSVHDLLCMVTSTKTDEELKRELDEHRDWVRNRNIWGGDERTDIGSRRIICHRPSRRACVRRAPRLEKPLPRLTSCRLSVKRSYVDNLTSLPLC